MNNQKPSEESSNELGVILRVYSDIWSDILLDRNLFSHLIKMDEDLGHLNKLIDAMEGRNQNVLKYYKITNQLYRMRDIVQDKIKHLKL